MKYLINLFFVLFVLTPSLCFSWGEVTRPLLKSNGVGYGSDLVGYSGDSGSVTSALNSLDLSAVQRYATVADLRAATVPSYAQIIYLVERGNRFLVWDSANNAANVTADTQSGIYIAPNSDLTGASGVWVYRVTETYDFRWFGATFDGVTNDAVAIQAAIDTVEYLDGGRFVWPVATAALSATINIPSGIDVVGLSLPDSKIQVLAGFVGNYVFDLDDTYSHNTIERLFIEFDSIAGVGGIKALQLYDYSKISFIVGNDCTGKFLDFGDVSAVSQTIEISNNLVYGADNLTDPLFIGTRLQECYVVNNKFFGDAALPSNTAIAQLESATGNLLLNNSFVNSSGYGLELKGVLDVRVSGNKIIGNIFENLTGTYSISIVGDSTPRSG